MARITQTCNTTLAKFQVY